jgi:hypothetical protein
MKNGTTLNIPDSTVLQRTDINLPFNLVGDEAFAFAS